jgi:hypothetical protein
MAPGTTGTCGIVGPFSPPRPGKPTLLGLSYPPWAGSGGAGAVFHHQASSEIAVTFLNQLGSTGLRGLRAPS